MNEMLLMILMQQVQVLHRMCNPNYTNKDAAETQFQQVIDAFTDFMGDCSRQLKDVHGISLGWHIDDDTKSPVDDAVLDGMVGAIEQMNAEEAAKESGLRVTTE